MTDIIVRYKEGHTATILKKKGWERDAFVNFFPRFRFLNPDLRKDSKVFHLEGDKIIGYSVTCRYGAKRIVGIQIAHYRAASSFKYIEPIHLKIDLELESAWVEAKFDKVTVRASGCHSEPVEESRG